MRGFKNGSISGDFGYNIKNELGVNLGQAVLPYVNVENPSKYLSYLNYFTVTPFYDYGFVRAKGGEQSGRVSGGGFKTSFNHKNINASLTFSYAISKSQLLLQNRDENSAVYFDIATEFGFF